MVERGPLTLRRVPRQSRSRMTVDAIVEATGQILERDGLEAMNTNAVAERAGVSVGSLYQYFPSKASLLAELYARERRFMAEALSAELQAHVHDDPDILAEAIVRAFQVTWTRMPVTGKALAEQAPRLGVVAKGEDSRADAIELLRELFTLRWSDQHRERSPAAAAFTLFHAIDAVVRESVSHAHPEAVRDEAERMLARLL